MRSLTVLGFALLALLCASCAELPARRYGVNELRFEGVHEVDPEALRVCLATEAREKLTLGLAALRSPKCGEPPFDKARASKRLFAWGWSDWPTYDEAVLKLDLERITRWYRARGYYGARVTDVRYDPLEAKDKDESAKCPKGCKVDVTVVVQEGTPVRVRKIELRGAEKLTPKLQKQLQKALRFKRLQIFDESVYDQGKGDLEKVLREEGFARAKVTGDVVIARAQNYVDIHLKVDPGPVCRIGKVRVQSSEPVPIGPILATTLLKKGQIYRDSDFDDAQRSIYALGAFAAVNVHGDLDSSGESEVVDVVIEVEPRRKSQVQLGAGIMSGVLATGAAAADQFSVPQWDVHLLGSYEHRNFMGGLRKFRIEDRPRLLLLGSFPRVPEKPAFGNLITVSFVQPGVIEPRTSLFVELREDYGPDPFQLFFRNDIGAAIGLERGFWKQQLKLRGALHQEFMIVTKHRRQYILKDRYPDELPANTPPERLSPNCLPYGEERLRGEQREDCALTYGDVVPSSYFLPFIEQRATLDLRDDAANPTLGMYFALSLHEAVRIMDKSWNYVRVMPDLRGYVPIGLGMVLAARFAMGALFIWNPDEKLDIDQRRLGPQTYRLRGGGAQSNRGFLPGQLGDSLRGGSRSWESSLEWRIPLAKDFSIVGFGDIGDVHGPIDGTTPRFRFANLNTTFGGGMRYRTIVGPIRLDVGYRPKGLQRADGSPGEDDKTGFGKAKFRGAIHLTIGEAF